MPPGSRQAPVGILVCTPARHCSAVVNVLHHTGGGNVHDKLPRIPDQVVGVPVFPD